MKTLTTAFLEQRDRWILWAPVPVACGIGLYFSLMAEPPRLLGAGALGALLLALPFYRRNVPALYAWAVLFLFALGFAAAQARTASVEAPALHKKTWPAPVIRGRIVDIEPLEKAWRVTLDSLAFSEHAQEQMPERLRIKLKNKDPAVPRAGDIVELRASLMPLSKPAMPGSFDFQRHAYFMGLGATGYALSDLKVVTPDDTRYFFEGLRETIRARIDAAGVADRDTAGLIKAFVIGDDRAISAEDWDIARDSGIAHLIAISGSHFVMIVGVFFFALRAMLAAVPYVALRWPVKKIAAAAGMAAAVFYMLLIGAPIPAQRAAVMSCAIMLAVILDRDPLTLRIAALAALIVLLLEPESLVGASFQLSFAAVTGLIAFFEARRGKWAEAAARKEKFTSTIALVFMAGLLTTLVASAATAPFALHHFLRVPFLAGLVANMVAVPLSSFVTFPAGLAACLLMPFGLEKPALWVMAGSIRIIMYTAETVAAWPDTSLRASAWPAGLLAVIALGGLWLCLWRGKMRWLGLLPAAAACALIPLTLRPDVVIGGPFRLLAGVRGPEGTFWLSPGRHDGFVRDIWMEREGRRGGGTWDEAGAADFIACDERACVYKAKGKTVVFVKYTDFPPDPARPPPDLAALARDCAAADIVVLPAMKIPRECYRGRATVIDKWDIYDEGAHAVYFGKDGTPPRIISVLDTRGVRPWTGRAPRHR